MALSLRTFTKLDAYLPASVVRPQSPSWDLASSDLAVDPMFCVHERLIGDRRSPDPNVRECQDCRSRIELL